MFVLHRKHGLLRNLFTLLYVDDVRTSQETHLWASAPCYGDSFTLLYLDNVRTSQGAYASTACYRDIFTVLSVDDVRTSQEARPLMESVYFFMCR
jgi:hypothetical protein